MPAVQAWGVGGVFFRAKDPKRLSKWYKETFGIPRPEATPWQTEAGITVFAPFDEDTDYFGTAQWAMVNLRIADLDGALTALAEAGVPVVKEVESMDGVGRFVWVEDPEGNRIELWEPASGLG